MDLFFFFSFSIFFFFFFCFGEGHMGGGWTWADWEVNVMGVHYWNFQMINTNIILINNHGGKINKNAKSWLQHNHMRGLARMEGFHHCRKFHCSYINPNCSFPSLHPSSYPHVSPLFQVCSSSTYLKKIAGFPGITTKIGLTSCN